MIIVILLVLILFYFMKYESDPNEISSSNYKTKNFHLSDNRSKDIFEEMKKQNMSNENLEMFLILEDRLLGLEKLSVCHKQSYMKEAVSISNQIKNRYIGYDFSYHSKHIKQISEPHKIINRKIRC